VLAPPLPSRTIISFSIYHNVSFMLTLNQPPSSSHKVSVPPTKLPSLQLLPVQPIPRPLLLATLLPVPPPLPALPLHQPKMLHHLQTLGSLDLVLVWLLPVWSLLSYKFEQLAVRWRTFEKLGITAVATVM
jgi:hypothetical protein